MNSNLKCNFACGDCFHSDWINVECSRVAVRVIKCDFKSKWSFVDQVDVIYSSQVSDYSPNTKGVCFFRRLMKNLEAVELFRRCLCFI